VKVTVDVKLRSPGSSGLPVFASVTLARRISSEPATVCDAGSRKLRLRCMSRRWVSIWPNWAESRTTVLSEGIARVGPAGNVRTASSPRTVTGGLDL